MNYEIKYKNIRHGYARIVHGELCITIPNYLKNNRYFEDQLLKKGEILLGKYKKKLQIQTHGNDFVILFGEKVRRKFKTEKEKKNFLEKTLNDYAKPIIEKYSDLLGYSCRKLIVRKTRSKWGSCTGDSKISLNLNLIHLPTKFVRYVIIHEVCHLKYKNHSKKFRDLVAEICPDYKSVRKEMRNLEFNN